MTIIYDPRGIVDAAPVPLAPRIAALGALNGLRLGILDNTKWNANRLPRAGVNLLVGERAQGVLDHG